MENILITRYMSLFNTLSLELKLELLSQLTESIKAEVHTKPSADKEAVIDELFGAWSDTEEEMTPIIYASRTTSDRHPSFD